MSYYSEKQYKQKDNLWFEHFYFDRWFKDCKGPILDMGCATGNFVATHPNIIEGVEFDEDSLRICQERNLNVRSLDISKDLGQLDSNKYEGVYAKQIIEHLQAPLDFLKHINRILKNNGKAVILTPNCPYALSRFFWDDYTHVRPLTRISLERLALDAGFKKINIYTDFRSFPGLGLLIRRFKLSPKLISKVQNLFFVRGLSLILEVEK